MASVIVSSDNLNAVDPVIPIETDTDHPPTKTLPNSDHNNEPNDAIRTESQQTVSSDDQINVQAFTSEENRVEYTNSDVIAGNEANEAVQNAPIRDTLASDANNISDNL